MGVRSLGFITFATASAWQLGPLASPQKARAPSVSMYGEVGFYFSHLGDGQAPTGASFFASTMGAALTTAVLAPFVTRTEDAASIADASVVDEDDYCEMIDVQPAASTMHQPYYDYNSEEAEEKDWWVCPDATLADAVSCMAIDRDGDYQVACAY